MTTLKRQPRWNVLVALTGGVVVGLTVLATRSVVDDAQPVDGRPEVAKPSAALVASVEHAVVSEPRPDERRNTPAPSVSSPAYAEAARLRAPAELRAAQPLVRVGDELVFGRDLVGFSAGETSRTMTPEMYAFLLDRAVERVLTFTAARAAGIALGEPARAQLEAVRAQAVARGSTRPGARELAEVELEIRDAEAQLLQGELLARAGHPRPLPTDADVRAYEHAHHHELEPLPDSEPARHEALLERRRAIRAQLSSEAQERWSRARGEWLSREKLSAEIALLD